MTEEMQYSLLLRKPLVRGAVFEIRQGLTISGIILEKKDSVLFSSSAGATPQRFYWTKPFLSLVLLTVGVKPTGATLTVPILPFGRSERKQARSKDVSLVLMPTDRQSILSSKRECLCTVYST